MNVAQHRAHLGAQSAGQGDAMALDRRHVEAELTERRRHLAADEPEAHDGDARRTLGGGADAVRVLHGAELEDAGQAGARRLERAVAAARRHEELVIGEPLAPRQHDLLPRGIDGGGGDPEAELDARGGIVVGGLHELVLEPVLPAQVALRQRRTVIGQPGLRADEHDLAVESPLAQRGGGSGAGRDAPMMTMRSRAMCRSPWPDGTPHPNSPPLTPHPALSPIGERAG